MDQTTQKQTNRKRVKISTFPQSKIVYEIRKSVY